MCIRDRRKAMQRHSGTACDRRAFCVGRFCALGCGSEAWALVRGSPPHRGGLPRHLSAQQRQVWRLMSATSRFSRKLRRFGGAPTSGR
eukprot:11863931-Alexandrium_andersonii.AAC.1